MFAESINGLLAEVINTLFAAWINESTDGLFKGLIFGGDAVVDESSHKINLKRLKEYKDQQLHMV